MYPISDKSFLECTWTVAESKYKGISSQMFYELVLFQVNFWSVLWSDRADNYLITKSSGESWSIWMRQKLNEISLFFLEKNF